LIDDIFDKLPKRLQIEIIENIAKKDLTESEKAKIQKMLRVELGKHSQQGKRTDLSTSSKNLEKVSHGVLEDIGKLFNESHEKIRQRQYVFERIAKAPNKHPNLKKRLDTGATKISAAYNILYSEEVKNRPTPDLPKGEFEVIVPDFPWHHDRPNPNTPPYKTMTLEEIKKEFPKLPAYKSCVLLMWATAPKLEDALELITFYGFRYVTHLIWVKTKDEKLWYEEKISDTKLQQNIGPNLNGSHELLLMATKGNPRTPLFKPPSVIFAERTESGRKPRAVYRLIEKMYANKRKKLELFAREKDPDDDGTWTYYGDELDDRKRRS